MWESIGSISSFRYSALFCSSWLCIKVRCWILWQRGCCHICSDADLLPVGKWDVVCNLQAWDPLVYVQSMFADATVADGSSCTIPCLSCSCSCRFVVWRRALSSGHVWQPLLTSTWWVLSAGTGLRTSFTALVHFLGECGICSLLSSLRKRNSVDLCDVQWTQIIFSTSKYTMYCGHIGLSPHPQMYFK